MQADVDMQATSTPIGQRQRVIETAIALLMVSVLIVATFWVLLPFVGILIYAVILATATATPFDFLVRLLGGRRSLAALLFGAIATTITIVPLVYLTTSIVDLVRVVGAWLSAASVQGIPDLPSWIAGLPNVGQKLTLAWQELQRDAVVVLQQYQHQLAAAGRWLLGLGAGIAIAIVEIFLGVIVAAMIHASRTEIVGYASAMTEHIVGPRGNRLLDAARKAVRGVAIGVIGTALIEGVLAWIGFAIAGVPGAIALAAVTFFLAVIQVGPLLVWLPVAIWLGSEGQLGWAIFLGIWGVVLLMGTDNIVKPILIARSGRLPLLVLFVGVIGGLAAWGFTGMFIGATVLAVLWTVLQAWLGLGEGRIGPLAAPLTAAGHIDHVNPS